MRQVELTIAVKITTYNISKNVFMTKTRSKETSIFVTEKFDILPHNKEKNVRNGSGFNKFRIHKVGLWCEELSTKPKVIYG